MGTIAYRLGHDSKMYRNTGTYGTPTWNEIPGVTDVVCEDTMNEIEMTPRAAGGTQCVFPGTRAWQCDFSMPYIVGDADIDAIEAAYIARGTLDILVLEGSSATTGVKGHRAQVVVTKFTKGEPINGLQTRDITFKTTLDSSSNPPLQAYTVA